MALPNEETGSVTDPSTRQFVLWGLSALGIEVESRGGEDHRLLWTEEHGPPPPATEFSFNAGGEDGGPLRPDHPLVAWILEGLRRAGPAVHARPVEQPVGVHELTGSLFAAYQVDEGSIHLAGCRLEDRPLLRLTWFVGLGNGTQSRHLMHRFFRRDGTLIDERLVDQLKLAALDVPARPLTFHSGELQRWVDQARAGESNWFSDQHPELALATIVWCKFAIGKLSLAIGSHSEEVAFSGWAQLLSSGMLTPPPFTCATTGKESYHVSATDDGKISVADAIGVCSESGRRVLGSDLETCTATGKLALPEYLETCSLTGERVMASALAVCATCQERVDPQTIENEVCSACRSLRRVRRDDPLMVQVLGEYPRLNRLPWWQCAETHQRYILVGSSYWKKLMIVLDKETLDACHVAAGSRLGRGWQQISEEAMQALLERSG